MIRTDVENGVPVMEVEVVNPDALNEDDLRIDLDDPLKPGDTVLWNCWPEEKQGHIVRVWTDDDGDDWVELRFDDDHKNINVETYEVRKVYV